jgi:hypothetical protein
MDQVSACGLYTFSLMRRPQARQGWASRDNSALWRKNLRSRWVRLGPCVDSDSRPPSTRLGLVDLSRLSFISLVSAQSALGTRSEPNKHPRTTASDRGSAPLHMQTIGGGASASISPPHQRARSQADPLSSHPSPPPRYAPCCASPELKRWTLHNIAGSSGPVACRSSPSHPARPTRPALPPRISIMFWNLNAFFGRSKPCSSTPASPELASEPASNSSAYDFLDYEEHEYVDTHFATSCIR